MSDKSPVELVHRSGIALVFAPQKGPQRCFDCFCNWFGGCAVSPCNSQNRSDGQVGLWVEKGSAK